jgi:hypothetical protein
MKKHFFLAGLLLPLGVLHAQQNPTNTFPTTATNGTSSNQFWSRAGNTEAFGSNNIFGTLWNSPIWVQTNGLNRVQFFSNQGSAAQPWVTPLPYGGGMGINLDPSNPVRNPLSLLHIGENLQTGTQGGYRSWMQVGTFMGHRSDQFYVGTKPETSPANDRTDAVINWGDNTNLVGGPTEYGPDYLRFIFTAPFGASGYNTYAAGNDGLEIMRLQPDGSVGIGNFYNDVLFPYKSPARRLEILSNKTTATANGTPVMRMTHTQQNPGALTTTGKYVDFEPRATGDLVIQSLDNTQPIFPTKNFKERFVGINTANPGNTLEINSQWAGPNTLTGATPTSTGFSGLRFTDLNSTSVPQTNPGAGFLSVNTTGDVVYVEAPLPSSTFGAACSNPTGGALTFDTKVNLNNFNLYFTNAGTIGKNRIGIGYGCGTTINAKFNVLQKEPAATPVNTIAGHFDNTDVATATLQTLIGAQGYARGVQTVDRVQLIGGHFTAYNSRKNTGVYGRAETGTWPASIPAVNVAGDFEAFYASSVGVRARATGTSNSTGVSGIALNSPSNIGGSFSSEALNPTSLSYGILASGGPSGSTLNSIRAGYFSGIVEAGLFLQGSDQQFKTNVANLDGTLEILSTLQPHQYYFDTINYERLNFGTGLQFGFIAQEVESKYPNLVHSSTLPAEYDSLGVEIAPAIKYKSLNYTAIIPLNTQAIIELNNKVDSKDSIINAQSAQITDLNNRLTNLENCLSALLPTLCSMNQSLIQNNSDEQQALVRKDIAVTLSNKDAIVLDQNVPNPFAEQTVINFSIPETVKKAQIHFYDGQGKLMQSVDVADRGLGSLTVFGSDLSTGVYTYTLVADGQVVATKKMMKQ